jgi:hypothetical protein
MSKKSVPLAAILAILLGPIGLLYASITGGLVLIGAGLVSGIILGNHAIIGGMIIWLISIGWAFMAAGAANAEAAIAENDAGNDSDWQALAKYDPDAKEAIEIVAPLGDGAVNELYRAHRAMKDPKKLPQVAAQIAEEHKAAATSNDGTRRCPNCKTATTAAVCPDCNTWIGA